MKRKLMLLCWVGMLALMILPQVPAAHAIEGLKGSWSLGLYSALNQSEIDTWGGTYEFSFTVVNASIGYFLTDHLELNFSPTIARAEAEDMEMSLTNYFGNIKYNFYGDKWQAVPYVGLQGGATSINVEYTETSDEGGVLEDNSESYDDTSYSFGFIGGIKVFLSENLSLDVEYNWLYSPDLVADLTMSTVFVGLKWYFGGD